MLRQRFYSIYILAGIFLFIPPLTAQLRTADAITSYRKIPGGIEGKTRFTRFEIKAWSANTIRVRITKEKTFNSVQYALAADTGSFYPAVVNNKDKQIEIVTPALTCVVEQSPYFRVIFKNAAGEIIQEDMPGAGFGTSWLGDKVSLYKKMQEGERFLGLGEVLGPLDKRGMAFTLNNTDTYKYGDSRLSMYISIPFYIGVHHQQVYGLYFNNTWKTQFNFGISTPQFSSINADGGEADYFFFYDQSISGILNQYSTITGKMPLPPKWSLGYHQSRCSYYPQSNVEILGETFRRKQIPVDGIVLDADYQQDYEPFRVNKERFPDLPGLSRKLESMNISLTASVYPGVKLDSTYNSYTDGLKNEVFIKYADGSLFETEIAPLRCYLPDYTNPKTREWWIRKMKWMEENGIRGYWNDMNEPAVGGSYLPDNLLFDFDGRKAAAPEAKNVYGFQMARSSYEAALRFGKDKRPFVLTRSAFAGVQRYAAVWSGDNMATNEGLLSGVLLNSQMGLSGMPFVGPDLGGYIGDGSKDLFKRWMQVGVFSPYLRNHKEFFATANEPWSYGEEAEAISKTYIGFRYRLMPYLYSKFYEAAQTGLPVARSLALDYPFDTPVYDNTYQYQFLFGDAIMVVPVTTEEKSKKVYLPDGGWYDLFTDLLYSGNREIISGTPAYSIPLFVKSSAIILVQGLVQSTRDKASDTLQIHVYKGTTNNRFLFYEDAGEGNGYKEGEFAKRFIEYTPSGRQLKLGDTEGSFISAYKKIQWIFHGFGKEMERVNVNGASQEPVQYTGRMLDPLKDLEDYYGKDRVKGLYLADPVFKQVSLVTDNPRNELIIQW